MTTIGPKKDGGPNIEFFQSPESLAQFDQIRVWLQKNSKKVIKTQRSFLLHAFLSFRASLSLIIWSYWAVIR